MGLTLGARVGCCNNSAHTRWDGPVGCSCPPPLTLPPPPTRWDVPVGGYKQPRACATLALTFCYVWLSLPLSACLPGVWAPVAGLQVENVKDNLLLQLEILGRWLAVLVIIALIAFLLAMFHAGNNFKTAFESAVAVAVSIIPEGLPAMVRSVVLVGRLSPRA